MIHYWPIENNVNDVIGSYDLYGQYVKYAKDQYGKQNSAVVFDGTYFLMVNKKIVDAFAGDFTISLWAYFTQLSRYDKKTLKIKVNLLIFDFGKKNDGNLLLFYDGLNVILTYDSIKSEKSMIFMIRKQIAVNEWCHIAFSLDGNIMTGYFNGIKDSSKDWKLLTVINTEGRYRIGEKVDSDEMSSLSFTDLMIFDRSLGAGEILTLKNLWKFTTQIIKK